MIQLFQWVKLVQEDNWLKGSIFARVELVQGFNGSSVELFQVLPRFKVLIGLSF